jgi:predicted alpha/beta-fold hydrolase
LRLKQEAWPGVYDFGEMTGDTSLRSMTERMVLQHTEYPDLASYLQGYAVTEGVLEPLTAPTAIITAADDPLILERDLARLARPASLELTVTPRGGHCGYMDALRGPSWIDRRIAFELGRD